MQHPLSIRAGPNPAANAPYPRALTICGNPWRPDWALPGPSRSHGHQQRENISEWRARHRQGGLGQVPAALSIVNNRGRGSPARSLVACSRGVVWPKRTRQNNSSISARRIAALLKACAARDSVCAQGFACAASRAAARARGLGAASRRPWACRAALTDSARTGQLAGTCNRPWCTASARQDCASRTTSAGTEGDWTDKQSSVASSSSPLHRAQPSRARREGTILRRAGREGQIRDVLSPAGFSSPHETEG